MIKNVQYYGYKFDFKQFKKGDVVVLCGYDCSISNERDIYPDRGNFQLSTISEVGEDYIKVDGCKFVQAIESTFYYELQNGDKCKDVEYTDEYLKITKVRDMDFNSVDGNLYDSHWGYVHKGRKVYRVKYLFPYNKNWKDKVDYCKQKQQERDNRKLEEEQEKQRVLNMKQNSRDEYNSIIDPLVKRLKELEKQIEEERNKAFDKCFCSVCRNNGKICSFERYWQSYDIDTEKHIDKDGFRTRPNDDCKFFEKN